MPVVLNGPLLDDLVAEGEGEVGVVLAGEARGVDVDGRLAGAVADGAEPSAGGRVVHRSPVGV